MFLVATIGLVSADVNFRYSADYAIIEDDGTFTTTTTPVNGFSSVGYECLDADCSLVGAQIPGLTSTTTSDEIIVVYPTALVNENGYLLYFYDDDYIGRWRPCVKIWGDFPDQTFDDPSPIYLAKKRSGYAPIMGMNVVNQVRPNIPVEVGVSVGIDADTYSAINDTRQSDAPLNEDVETMVFLEIIDSDGDVIYADSQTLYISYSGVASASFTYAGFSDTGSYDVRLYTNVTDAKILNSQVNGETSTITGIEVIPANLTNYTYTFIRNLEMNPRKPEEGTTADFTFDYLSNHMDENGVLTPVSTRVETSIYRDGVLREQNVYYLNATSSATSLASYAFSHSLTHDGSYRVVVRGDPESTLGSVSYGMQQELTFVIEDNDGYFPDDDDNGGNDDDDDDDDENELKLLLANKQNAEEADVLDLTTEGLTKLEKLKRIMWILFWIILALILLILAIVLYRKYRK